MNLKKGESKQLKLSYYAYKTFLKRNNIYLSIVGYKKSQLELKITLIFSLIYITLKTTDEISKIDKQTIKEIYQIFFVNKVGDTKKYLINLLDDATKKFNLGFRLEHLDTGELYKNLTSFYTNSEILNYFKKKAKLKKLNITDEWNHKFISLNKSLKFILNFIKNSSPNRFNSIYRKIMLLV